MPYELNYTPLDVIKDSEIEIRDPKDLPILNSAIVSDVDIFITGDKDLLQMADEKDRHDGSWLDSSVVDPCKAAVKSTWSDLVLFSFVLGYDVGTNGALCRRTMEIKGAGAFFQLYHRCERCRI